MIASRLRRFGQWHSWDAQRIGGRFHPEFRDYATVAIGMYSAAANINPNDILSVQNGYAAIFSHFDPRERMDDSYKSLPTRNVLDTRMGYDLVRTGRIGSGRPR